MAERDLHSATVGRSHWPRDAWLLFAPWRAPRSSRDAAGAKRAVNERSDSGRPRLASGCRPRPQPGEATIDWLDGLDSCRARSLDRPTRPGSEAARGPERSRAGSSDVAGVEPGAGGAAGHWPTADPLPGSGSTTIRGIRSRGVQAPAERGASSLSLDPRCMLGSGPCGRPRGSGEIRPRSSRQLDVSGGHPRPARGLGRISGLPGQGGSVRRTRTPLPSSGAGRSDGRLAACRPNGRGPCARASCWSTPCRPRGPTSPDPACPA